MVLILTERKDTMSYEVYSHIKNNGHKVFLIFPDSEIEVLYITIDGFSLKVDGEILVSDEITSFWHRRGHIPMNEGILKICKESEILDYFKTDLKTLYDVLYFVLFKRNLNIMGTNRVINFFYAKKCGIDIPNFIITQSKLELVKFKQTYNDIIVKSFSDGIFLKNEISVTMNYTELYTWDDLLITPASFFPSLFVEYIHKKYEIRVFIFDSLLYSVVFLTQSENNTKVDMRRSSKGTPQRIFEIYLPTDIQGKLLSLLSILSISSASIDLIYGSDGNYYFLDLNPFGQFEVVHQNSNNSITYEIANKLCQNIQAN